MIKENSPCLSNFIYSFDLLVFFLFLLADNASLRMRKYIRFRLGHKHEPGGKQFIQLRAIRRDENVSRIAAEAGRWTHFLLAKLRGERG